MNENGDATVLQKFVSEDGQRLASLPPTYTKIPIPQANDMCCGTTYNALFPDVDHLEDPKGRRELHMVDEEYQLYVCQTLRS